MCTQFAEQWMPDSSVPASGLMPKVETASWHVDSGRSIRLTDAGVSQPIDVAEL